VSGVQLAGSCGRAKTRHNSPPTEKPPYYNVVKKKEIKRGKPCRRHSKTIA
jgi:hypothetical protein